MWFDSQPARYQTEIQEGSIRVSGRKSKIWYGQILPAQSQDIRRLCKYRKKGNIHTHNIKTLTTYQTGKSRCDAVYKESKRYDYLVQRILSAIGKNDKHRIAKVSSIPISWGQFHFWKRTLKGIGFLILWEKREFICNNRFPYIIRCKLRSTIGKGRGKQASAEERHSSPTTSSKSLRNAKKPLLGHFSLKNAFFFDFWSKSRQNEPIWTNSVSFILYIFAPKYELVINVNWYS